MDHARWIEEQNRHVSELRSALAAHVTDNDLRLIVESGVSHYDELFRLKGIAVKADVFHIVSGMWKTPAERCFMWMGGFRPSELLKVCQFIYMYLYMHMYVTVNVCMYVLLYISHSYFFFVVSMCASFYMLELKH